MTKFSIRELKEAKQAAKRDAMETGYKGNAPLRDGFLVSYVQLHRRGTGTTIDHYTLNHTDLAVNLELNQTINTYFLSVVNNKVGEVLNDKTQMEDSVEITEQSKQLFIAYIEDAGNWGGTPMVGGNVTVVGEKEDRGNLTQLKRAGLLTTFNDYGCAWVQFTEAGVEYAKSLGLADPTE